jgi:hypothetical protein
MQARQPPLYVWDHSKDSDSIRSQKRTEVGNITSYTGIDIQYFILGAQRTHLLL